MYKYDFVTIATQSSSNPMPSCVLQPTLSVIRKPTAKACLVDCTILENNRHIKFVPTQPCKYDANWLMNASRVSIRKVKINGQLTVSLSYSVVFEREEHGEVFEILRHKKWAITYILSKREFQWYNSFLIEKRVNTRLTLTFDLDLDHATMYKCVHRIADPTKHKNRHFDHFHTLSECAAIRIYKIPCFCDWLPWKLAVTSVRRNFRIADKVFFVQGVMLFRTRHVGKFLLSMHTGPPKSTIWH